MGAFQSTKGIKNAIIGDETIAKFPLPEKDDSRWQPAGEISQLYIYPVKSFCGKSVERAKIEKHGLTNGPLVDRQFIVVNEKNAKVTGRQFSKLAIIKTDFDGSTLTLNAEGRETIQATIPMVGETVYTEVFGMKCEGIDMGPEIGAWIAEHLEKSHLKLRLVYHDYSDKNSTRQLQASNMALRPLTKVDDVPLYADGYGFLLLNEDSVASLNQKLTSLQVQHERFRPNIVVKDTAIGFCEDDWLFIKINENVFRHASMCGRCVFTTVNPHDGSRDPNGEPLKTLKSFRTSLDPREKEEYQNSPFFGINLGIDNHGGSVNVGDKVFAIKNNDKSSLMPCLLLFPLPILLMFIWKRKYFS